MFYLKLSDKEPKSIQDAVDTCKAIGQDIPHFMTIAVRENLRTKYNLNFVNRDQNASEFTNFVTLNYKIYCQRKYQCYVGVSV